MKPHDPKLDVVNLAYIKECCRFILEHIEGIVFEDFKRSPSSQAAIHHWLETMGDASKQLSERTKGRYDINWREMARQRDMLAHHYRRATPERLWDTAVNDIPGVMEKLLQVED